MASLCVTYGLRLISTKRYFIRIHAAYILNQRPKKLDLRTMTVATATDLQLLHFSPYSFIDS
jgi:hypothetical protein